MEKFRGIIYSKYIPMEPVPTVSGKKIDEKSISRYAKKEVNPNYYGVIQVKFGKEKI